MAMPTSALLDKHCSESTPRKMRSKASTINIVDLDWVESAPDFLVLCTDGVAKSFPTTAACLQAMSQFRQLCASPANTFACVARELPTWLSEVSPRGSGDDASMLMAVRKTVADIW
jgi:hypothetical protein